MYACESEGRSLIRWLSKLVVSVLSNLHATGGGGRQKYNTCKNFQPLFFTHLKCVLCARGCAVEGSVRCRMHPVLGSWLRFPRRPTKSSISPDPVNWYQTGPRKTKHWLVPRLATLSHCIGRYEMPSLDPGWVEYFRHPRKGWLTSSVIDYPIFISRIVLLLMANGWSYKRKYCFFPLRSAA